uniref:Succinate dehydrogenase subunit A-like protein n=1 Tax=Acidithiobacillus caldus TaxID=33059 RepID=B1A4I9_9PROT|nr:fumarate reductase/succinate dehydrogenase flavoprotein subunit [Acidithiobacillus caldus]ACA00167.1 succinate dehydrogenase subunit A-like protein [Acidithiobacillus caldus]
MDKNFSETTVDIIVVGGGTAGPMAAIAAKEANRDLAVLLIEKANVKRSGAISMGMDGLNNAVIPGHASPEQYVKEITIANDGIVDQSAILTYASKSFDMITRLDRMGVKFEKDETGDFNVKKVHHLGNYVLPMPEGHDMKTILYRHLKKHRVEITNRKKVTRVLTSNDRTVSGVIAVDTRTSEITLIHAKAVILCTGAAGRLGLPASGYLFGTYENPTNAGDGHAMALHAGAKLANLECFQINPLIKDYNGPACAYVTGPFGGYTANSRGERFIECDYWSGQMMMEFFKELQGGNGPVYLKLNHLAEETIQTIETILHTNERPSRGRFHSGRGTDYRQQMIEMHISEIGFCSGHSASGVYINSNAETSVKGLYAAGDVGSVPHNYMLGAFVYGEIAGRNAAIYCANTAHRSPDQEKVRAEINRIARLTNRNDGITPYQMEYKIRRIVNDYLQPPKIGTKLEIAEHRLAEIRDDLKYLYADDSHNLLRALEVCDILDCADMAASASIFRTESRWGLYHYRVDYPERNDDSWFCHVHLSKDDNGKLKCIKVPVEPYICPPDETEVKSYERLRIAAKASVC